MSQAFNPYREWLGVTSPSETPSYYELLALRPLEPDLGKIEAAYQAQAARLAVQLSGGHADDAQQLLGELAEARMTLMTPTAKRAYDAALANAGQAARPSPVGQPSSNGNELNRATTSPASAAPIRAVAPAPIPASPQPAPNPVYAQPQPSGYPPAAYSTGSAYGPAQAYAPTPVYPQAQGYPSWQGQQAIPTAVQSGPVPGYYAAPAAGYQTAQEPVLAESSPAPSIRPRRTRRRSSLVPVLTGVAVAVVAILGGIWWYNHQNESVAIVPSNADRSISDEQKPAAHADKFSDPSSNRAEKKKSDDRSNAKPKLPPKSPDADAKRTIDPVMQVGEGEGRDSDMPAPRLTAGPTGRAQVEPEKTQPDKPAEEKPKSEPDKPEPEKTLPDKPAPDKPEPDKPKEEPKPEVKASAEELATVGKLLKSARAALASRNISQAQDLLAEATIEATAPDTTAEVNRLEMLASYVEMFWDAVRKTLPKIQLEELQINGTMIVVVEADENHLVIRAEGKNREYTWQKLPTDIARYLADRWLAPDDPVRNLVLASFEIVDPKGDRGEAKSLLDAADAAKLNAKPLLEELHATGGK